MDAALNQSGTLTWAGNAPHGGAYRCPCCKVRVIHASGPEQSAHFRHRARTPAEHELAQRCPLFIADQGGEAPAGLVNPPKRPPQPRPRLAFTWTKPDRGQQRWALAISVPSPPDRARVVRVDENINGDVDVLRDVVLANRQIWVRAAGRQYQITGYDKSRTVVWSPQPTDPLVTDAPNIFRTGAHGGLQLLPDESLVRGETYATLSRKGVWSQPPGGISRAVEGLPIADPRREWQGHLVYFPADAKSDVSAWCERVCRRSLVDPPPELGLVLPPTSAVWPDGTYRLGANEEVVLALRGGAWIDPVLEVVNEETGESREWRLSVEAGDFISLGKLPVGTYTIHVRDWEWVTLRIETVRADIPKVTGVVLKTTMQEGSEIQTGLFDSQATDRWSEILSGGVVRCGIELPDSWPVTLSWVAQGAEETRPNLDTPEAFETAIAECRRHSASEATLDGGVFGILGWEKPESISSPVTVPASLPAAFVSRLRWLRLARSQTSAAPTAPLGVSAPQNWTTLIAEPDRPVVAEFLTTRDWPLSLLAHARAAGKELFHRLRTSP